MSKCPIDKKFYEEQYIKLGKSTTQIAKEFGFSVTTIGRRLRKFRMIRSISEANSGERNGMWKANPNLISLHEWVRNHKLKSKFCEKCSKKESYDLANISGKYLRDINDYFWLCRSCHMKYDYKNGTRKPKKNKALPNL